MEPIPPAPVKQATAKLTLNLNPQKEVAEPRNEADSISSKVKICIKEDIPPPRRPLPSQSRKASVVAIDPSGQLSISTSEPKLPQAFREPNPVKIDPKFS